ncbi:MAG: M48 family metallopeptidase [Candidatus Helarchaeota archaeon]
MSETKSLKRIKGKLALSVLFSIALTFFTCYLLVALGSWFIFSTLDFINILIIASIYAGIQILLQFILAPWSIQSHFGNKLRFITQGENPQVWDMVDKMAQQAKVKFSKIGILQTDELNAFVYWGLGDGNTIVFTEGLINRLDTEELHGVCGHEIGHVKHGDLKAMIFLSTIPIFIHTFYSFSQSTGKYKKDSLSWLLIILVFFVALIVNTYLSLYISRLREYNADANSTQMMKSPVPIAAALAKITYKNIGKGNKLLATRKEINSLCIIDPHSVARQTNDLAKTINSIHEIADQIDDPDIDQNELEKEMEKEKKSGNELERTHPLTVNRIQFVVELSKEAGYI